jgi:hypothetical protein
MREVLSDFYSDFFRGQNSLNNKSEVITDFYSDFLKIINFLYS